MEYTADCACQDSKVAEGMGEDIESFERHIRKAARDGSRAIRFTLDPTSPKFPQCWDAVNELRKAGYKIETQPMACREDWAVTELLVRVEW